MLEMISLYYHLSINQSIGAPLILGNLSSNIQRPLGGRKILKAHIVKGKRLYETRQKKFVVLILNFQPWVKIKHRNTKIHKFSYESGVFLPDGHKFLIILRSK